MNLVFIGILAGAAALSWWLSGYDTMVTGENRAADCRRRAIRCGVTLLLMAAGLASRWLFIAVIVPLAVIWAGCLSELFTRGFHRLVDPTDTREFDPKQTARDLDKLAGLVQNGRNDEAIEWCKKLRETGDASTVAIETVLFQLYRRMFAGEDLHASPPLAEAQQLRAQGNPGESASQLESLLQKEPENLRAAFLLMRIYAQDLERPDKAEALLRTLGQRPHVPPVFVEYARRSLLEGSGVVPPQEKTTEGVESLLVDRPDSNRPETVADPGKASVDELLAGGHLATAIELLESQIKDQPESFNLWLKLAEAHGVYCRNLNRAGRIIGQIEANPAFTPEQIQLAKSKLREWRGSGQA
jgi:hypothetical protein